MENQKAAQAKICRNFTRNSIRTLLPTCITRFYRIWLSRRKRHVDFLVENLKQDSKAWYRIPGPLVRVAGLRAAGRAGEGCLRGAIRDRGSVSFWWWGRTWPCPHQGKGYFLHHDWLIDWSWVTYSPTNLQSLWLPGSLTDLLFDWLSYYRFVMRLPWSVGIVFHVYGDKVLVEGLKLLTFWGGHTL